MAESKTKKQSRFIAAFNSLSASALAGQVTNFLQAVSTTGWAAAVAGLDPVTSAAIIATTTIFGISHTCEGEAERRRAADLAEEFDKLRNQQGNAQYLLQEIANGEIGVTLDWFTRQELAERTSTMISDRLDEEFARVTEHIHQKSSLLDARLDELNGKLDRLTKEAVAERNKSAHTSPRRAVILTALGLEFSAVCKFLVDPHEELGTSGEVYKRGMFRTDSIVWDVLVAETGTGNVEAALHVKATITQFNPQVLLFVGVAGGLKDVKLGDVVASTKVYGYESGKQTTAFLARPMVASPAFALEQRARAVVRDGTWKLRISEPNAPVRSYMGAIAAGEKVLASRRSDLYKFLKATYGDALAIEMEGYGCLAATRHHPQVEALVIRGISDLISAKKQSDASGSQERAAHHASAFAFEVLAGLAGAGSPLYSTNSDVNVIDSETVPHTFMVPHHRNPHFKGRGSLLSNMRDRLLSGGKAALGQAIRGLGGIGKTQTAVEYAYIHRRNYNAILWAKADTEPDLTESYIEIADQLSLPYDHEKPADAIRTVRLWLEENENWLLIFDNADHPDLLKPFLPRFSTGHILLTSRAQLFDMLGIADPLNLPKLPITEAVEFLLDRTGRTGCSEQEMAAAKELAEDLDGLPLALEQAGAYMLAVKLSFKDYVNCFRRRKLQWLEKRGPTTGDYPDTVATTWNVSVTEVEQKSQASADLLRLSAFLGPDDIPFELVTGGASKLSPALSQALANAEEATPALQETLEILGRFSLVDVDIDQKTFSLHRLVQEVVRDAIELDSRETWAQRSLLMACLAFPDPEFKNWPTCRRLLPHTLIVAQTITKYELVSAESAHLLDQVAFFLDKQGRFPEAKPLYKQAMEIARTALGENHPEYATSLNNLAGLYKSTGHYYEAEPLYKQAMEIRRTVLGEEQPDFAQSLNNLAGLYRDMGRYAEAEPLYEQALEIRRTELGDKHPDFAQSLNNLAFLYRLTGRYVTAERFYKRALEIRRATLTEKHPDFAQSLNNVAFLYRMTGRYEEAELLYKQALEIKRNAFGENHPTVATGLNNLAFLYKVTGRCKEAESLYRQALAIKHAVLGTNHPSVANSLNNLALLYESTGRDADAEPLYKQALEIRRTVLGEEHPSFATSLYCLAGLYKSNGRYAEAEPLFKQALEIRRTALGENHPDFTGTLTNLTTLYRATRRDAKAKELERKYESSPD